MRLKHTMILLMGMLTAFSLSVTSAYAAKVTLKSLDGSVAMNGEIVGFDGEFYILKVSIGEFQIAVAEVTCDGEACPELVSTDFRLGGSSTLAQVLIPSLFQDFSSAYGLRLATGDAKLFGDVPVPPYMFTMPNEEVFADV